ncbi:hypothetical protein HF086_000576 [Spodoptera exigua]|uniref:Splicing factor YJU2 n=1 Tax=Spodoptera exigua TaxID=7107 RepID=A0A922MPW6_SPOEX|nr:hypothetical protein HF086_000576 [Spodoptera exigua]
MQIDYLLVYSLCVFTRFISLFYNNSSLLKMSERKVLNKYYPPDFDPSKIPRMKLAKNRQYTVRLMAPFNMRCATCGEYIYKGKKFNARKEDVENEDYLGIRIYRFYIKHTYAKYRTEQSKQEIETLEGLEELKELNRRQHAVDFEGMLKQYQPETSDERRAREEKEDDEFIKSIKFNNPSVKKVIAEEIIEEVKDEEDSGPPAKTSRIEIIPQRTSSLKKAESWNKSIGVLSKKSALSNLVKSKKDNGSSVSTTSVSTDVSSKVTTPASGLSLLADYSGSDSDSQ